MALDDITEENGAMEMFTFKYLPQTRDRNLGVKKVEETGADFFIKIEEDVLNNLPMENVVKMTLRRGQSEFHDAHILHRSSENRSSRYLFITSVTQSHKGSSHLKKKKKCDISHLG